MPVKKTQCLFHYTHAIFGCWNSPCLSRHVASIMRFNWIVGALQCLDPLHHLGQNSARKLHRLTSVVLILNSKNKTMSFRDLLSKIKDSKVVSILLPRFWTKSRYLSLGFPSVVHLPCSKGLHAARQLQAEIAVHLPSAVVVKWISILFGSFWDLRLINKGKTWWKKTTKLRICHKYAASTNNG